DAFFLYADGKTGKVTAVNGSGIAPRAYSRDYFVSRGYTKMPFYGPHSIGIPGAVDVYFIAIQRFCRLAVDDLFASALHYAENGFPLSETGSRTIAASAAELAKFPESAALLLRDGRELPAGAILANPALGRSLRQIAEGGPEAFYTGDLAARIADAVRSAGGEMTAADFSGHTSDVGEPITTDYRGWTVYETPLPTQGLIVLEELNILENANLAALGLNSAEAIHLMVEAKKRAFADRIAYTKDPRFGPSPVATLLSKAFAAQRFATIDPHRSADEVAPGALPEMDGDTTYLCTADADGNMVSFIHSLSAGFGSQMVAGDTGIILNNRAGRGFSLDEGHPNVIEGGKRTMHTLNCYAIGRNGRVEYVGGTPGGDQQPQWNMQVITNLLDFGLDVQGAVEAPRWNGFPGSDPINLPNPFDLRVESTVGQRTLEGLRARGHDVRVLGPLGAGGAAFVIRRVPDSGVLEGGSDPRSEGLALGI
ncbi:MAG: gamma-glutamyltransferase, partial [Chloroflexi bacterium]